MDKKLDLRRIAAVILGERADLVALQEVDRGVERTGRVDEIAELARLTRMEYAFAYNLSYQGGQYGVAVLSRYPILSVDHRRYRNLREAERRGLIRVEVEIEGRRLNFVTTHLDYKDDDNRLFETRQLVAALADVTGPLVVAGDFNDEPRGGSYKLMLENFIDAWAQAGAGAGLTYPADKPSKRIDYVFIRGRDLRARRAWVPQTLASDHVPVVVDVEFTSR
jgi:endonuclease/exonuclease/phosphatase family metal-dependent hydrolase